MLEILESMSELHERKAKPDALFLSIPSGSANASLNRVQGPDNPVIFSSTPQAMLIQ
jgi:hypothetical protein